MIANPSRGLFLLVPALLLACIDNSSSGGGAGTDTDGDTDTDTDASTTSMSETSASSSSSSTGSESASTGTTTSPGTTTAADESSSGEPDETTGGPADGTCWGLDPNGSFVEVLSRNGTEIDPACSDIPAPCAGDVLGEWSSEDSCGEDSLPTLWSTLCPEAVETVTEAGVEGTLTFNDDNTFERVQTTTVTSTLAIDAEGCLDVSCSELQDLMGKEPGVTATCEDVESGCECGVETVVEANESGTFEATDGELSLDFEGEEATLSACVSGDRLDLWTEQYAFTLTDEVCADEGDCADALGKEHAIYFCEPDAEE